MARPSKFTPDRRKRILEALRQGNTRKAAVAQAGISYETFCQWLHQYPEFSDQVKNAEAEAELASVRVIREAAVTTWQAAAWWLERRRPEEWSNSHVIRVKLEREVESLLDFLQKNLDTPTYERILDLLRSGGTSLAAVEGSK
jgi:transposase